MSEGSKSRVTITLGRAGQVVKRDGNALHSPNPVLGSKRSVHERLGNNVNSTAEINKRMRGDGRTSNANDDAHLTRGDLRYKIMQKNSLGQGQNSVDLRSLLSRPAQSSTNSITTRAHSNPYPNDTMPPYSEPRGTRDGSHFLPVTRNSLQHLHQSSEPRKHHALESRENGGSFLKEKDMRYRGPDSRMEPVVNSQSPWTLESLRKGPSEESLTTSRGGGLVAIAPKRDEILQRRLPVGEHGDARTRTCNISKESLEISRPMSSSQLTKMPPPVGRMKNIAPVTSPLPLPGSLAQKSSYMVDDQASVDSLLHSLGLEKYAIHFKAEEVDMYSLKRMTEEDLKEMGIPMGPRKKILLSLQPRVKQQQY